MIEKLLHVGEENQFPWSRREMKLETGLPNTKLPYSVFSISSRISYLMIYYFCGPSAMWSASVLFFFSQASVIF